MFFMFCILLLWRLASCWPWTVPYGVSQFLECAFQMQTNQSRAHIFNHLLYGALTLQATSHLPWSPQGQVPDHYGQPLYPGAQWLFKLADPKPVYPASPPSHGYHNKVTCLQFPLCFCLLSSCFPRISPLSWHSMPFLLGSVSIMVYLFSDSYLLICCSYYVPK